MNNQFPFSTGNSPHPQSLRLSNINFNNIQDDIFSRFNNMYNQLNTFRELLESLNQPEQHPVPEQIINELPEISIDSVEKLDGDKKVAGLIMQLVDFFRSSVKVNQPIVTLDDEIEMITAYLELMCYRYPKLHVTYDIDEKLLEYSVPNFILQPIVENSLLHGLKNKGYQGEILISAHKKDDNIEICVKDSGSGFEEGKKAEIDERLLHYDRETKLEGNSIGVVNVQKRIKLLCGKEYGLHYTENTDGGLTAHLLLGEGS